MKKKPVTKTLVQTSEKASGESKKNEDVKVAASSTAKTVTATAAKATTATVKTAETVKVAEPVKAVKDEVKADVKKTEDKASEVLKKAVQKTETVKAAVKKTAAKASVKKETVKAAVKNELQTEVYIQYSGRETFEQDIIARVKEAYVSEGHRANTIKTLQLYLKPEENAAYYVINKKIAGSVPLF